MDETAGRRARARTAEAIERWGKPARAAQRSERHGPGCAATLLGPNFLTLSSCALHGGLCLVAGLRLSVEVRVPLGRHDRAALLVRVARAVGAGIGVCRSRAHRCLVLWPSKNCERRRLEDSAKIFDWTPAIGVILDTGSLSIGSYLWLKGVSS